MNSSFSVCRSLFSSFLENYCNEFMYFTSIYEKNEEILDKMQEIMLLNVEIGNFS